MKKTFSFIMAIITIITIMTCMGTVASASEALPNVEVSVGTEVEETQVSDIWNTDSALGVNSNARAASANYDLGTDGSLNMTISNFIADSTRQSNYNYKTNSTKIKIKMKSNISIAVKVTLFDAATNKAVQQTTVTVGTIFSKTVTFSNLTSTNRYYIQYKNLGQQDVNITGSISA